MSVLRMVSFEFTGLQIENRLSTVSAGLSLTSIVFMILTSQVAVYFWKAPIHSRDPLWIKGLVISIWMMQALEFALSCHMTAVAHSNDSTLSMKMVKDWILEQAVYVATSATTECLVHAYFISRIYILETNQSHAISIMLCIMSIFEGAFGFITMLSFAIPFEESQSKPVILCWSLPLWLGLAILVDISIAGSIYYILRKDSPFKSMRLSLLVKQLTKFCIQTGLITSLVTGITIALWIAAQLDPEHFLMCFPAGGIYATCLMANLIARDSYLHHTELSSDDECFGMAMQSIVFATPEGTEKSEIISSG